MPLMARYELVRTTGAAEIYRRMLDSLTPRQIVWTPYEEYRQQHPLSPRALYSGFIRIGST